VSRPRVFAAVLLAVSLAVVVAAVFGRERLEQALRRRIQAEAAARGLVVEVESIRVGPWPPLALSGVRVERPGAWSAMTDSVHVTPLPWGRRARLAVGPATVTGPAGFGLDVVPTSWEVAAGDGLRAELLQPWGGLTASWLPAPGGGRLEGSVRDLPAGRIATLVRDATPLLDAGVATGTFRVALAEDRIRFEADAAGSGVRVVALEPDPLARGADAFGEPTEVVLQLDGSWEPKAGRLDLRRWRLTLDGAALAGSLILDDARGDPRMDLALDVQRMDFARLFRTSGLDRVEAVSTPGHPAEDLGSASLQARFRGRLGEPAGFVVSQRLDFTPPRRLPPAVARLRGDFVHEAERTGGGRSVLDVSPTSPDYIPLAEVPPLFLRTLLLAEDAGFYGHRGLDLGELPSAVLTNWARGQAARGASTITQQLAKNLFLTREKRMGRKLHELSLALLLEAALTKERILEIYLNVIEWGPGLHGLRPAARRYFHREPGELTPRQMAFLVALIPGPVKYQRSFARGTLSPGFRPLVDDLLAKVHSVQGLTDEEYQAALAEELAVDPGEPFFSAGR
jgi:penicillin-binding protein 1A